MDIRNDHPVIFRNALAVGRIVFMEITFVVDKISGICLIEKSLTEGDVNPLVGSFAFRFAVASEISQTLDSVTAQFQN